MRGAVTMKKLLLATAFAAALTMPAKAGDQPDPELLAQGAAILTLYNKHCATIPDSTKETYAIIVELVGRPKIIANMMKMEPYREEMGNAVFCSTIANGKWAKYVK